MDENTQAKFAEKVKELLNMAKKKKNVLEYQEISDFFADMPLEEEQMEKVLEYLDQNNVDVLRITDDDDVDDEEIILTDEDEVDVENIDLSVPEGVSIEDPVRMYLKDESLSHLWYDKPKCGRCFYVLSKLCKTDR